MLKESKDRLKRKYLEKTREGMLAGMDSEVAKIKYEIEKQRDELTSKA